jgi:alpha-tubulin suppressor-like RCC1 family protein
LTPNSTWRLALAAVLALPVAACSGDDGAGVATVDVSPANSSLSLGTTVQLVAGPRDANGDAVTASVTWRSSDTTLVAVSSTGVAVARDIGTATITASSEGVAGSADITTRMPVATVEVTPDTGTLILGDSLRPALILKDSLGNLLTDRDVAWSSGNSAVAAVTGAGEIIAVSAGAADVTATVEGKNGSAHLGVVAFKAIAAGEEHTCALTTDGAPYCWGAGSALPTAIPSPVEFKAITAGMEFTCALALSGAAYCWGNNGSGQLGDGTTTSHAAPTAVAGGLTFTAITGGDRFACGLTATGQAYCWGFNASGQLGNGTVVNSLVPISVSGGTMFSQIDAGSIHVCAVSKNASAEVFCWGSNSFLESGFGGDNPQMVPHAVPEALPYATISAGFGLSCGAKENGTAYCWGNYAGINGIPVEPWAGTTMKTVVIGYSSGCGLGFANQVYCWGDNQFGQVGSRDTGSPSSGATPVSGSARYTTITVGAYHACGITAVHLTYCWGRSDAGQVGRMLLTNRVPVRPTRAP